MEFSASRAFSAVAVLLLAGATMGVGQSAEVEPLPPLLTTPDYVAEEVHRLPPVAPSPGGYQPSARIDRIAPLPAIDPDTPDAVDSGATSGGDSVEQAAVAETEQVPLPADDTKQPAEDTKPTDESTEESTEESTDDGGEEVIAEPAPVEEVVVDEPPPKLWDVSFELGFNGSSGNSEAHSFHSATHTKRKGQINTLSLDVRYRRASQEGRDTANRLFTEWRSEWKIHGKRKTAYIHGTIEFDEFRAFDSRVTVDSGFGFQLLDSKTTTLTTRGGAGVSREFGGPDDSYVPEAVLGGDFEHKLTSRQKLQLSAEYFSDWTDYRAYRLNTKANWQVVVDEKANLSLKLGIIDRYDSTPNGVNPNDLDYFAVLLWSY